MECETCGAAMGNNDYPLVCELPHRGCPYFGEGPIRDCYGCKGTGYIIGFGHDGERCPCLDALEEI